MKVAFVHDWLVTYRGGEKVLESLLELYPNAPVYTMFYSPKTLPETITKRQVIYPKGVNFFRFSRKLLLPFYPAIIEGMPLEKYDLIISTSSCVAKGAMLGPNAKHICYIHTPMRYIWDQRHHYLHRLRKIPGIRFLVDCMSAQLRIWDISSNHRVDLFITNSSFVRQRVRKYYNRHASVVAPPVNVEQGKDILTAKVKEKYFLAAGAFVPYKRFDLAILACKLAGVKLVIAGDGPQKKKLRQMAGDHVEFHIAPDKEHWQSLMVHAEGFIFPGVEDFGITAIESLAAGTPVVAYRDGGALDFVEPEKTGLFFDRLEPESLADALKKFSKSNFDSQYLRQYASRYAKDIFQDKVKTLIHDTLEKT